MKGSVEGRLPSSDCVLVTLRMEESGGYVPLAPFDGLPPNLLHSPAIAEDILVGGFEMHIVWLNSRRQLIYRVTHGLTEIGQFLSIDPPVKRSADVSAVEPKFKEILLVSHRILDTCKFGADRHRRGGNVPLSL